MLEHYNRYCPNFHYQLTSESFAIVANTFAMKIPVPVEAAMMVAGGQTQCIMANGAQSSSESKVATAVSEPDLGSERTLLPKTEPSVEPQSGMKYDGNAILTTSSVLANLSSTYTKSTKKTHTTRLGQELTSYVFKAVAYCMNVLKALVKMMEAILKAFKARFCRDRS